MDCSNPCVFRLRSDSWKTLAERLRVGEYRSAGRRIRSIRHLHNELHELLWIPLGLDRQALAYTALELQRNLQTLCEQVSLKTLLTLPDGATVLKATRELQTMCADFATSAARNDTLDSWRWDFRPLDVQWQQYRSYFQESAAPELTLQLTDMDETVQSLQELLGIAPLLDLERALELAGQVDSLADLLQRDVMTRVQQSPRYTPQFRRDLAASAEAVHKLAHDLHDGLARQRQPESFRQRSDELAAAWQKLQEYVSKLEPMDQAVVTRNYERLAPAMVRLQMMFL